MNDPLHTNKCSMVLKAVSDLNRIKILELLSKSEMCVTDIVKNMKLDQPKVSHHLAILKRARIVLTKKQGRRIYYYFNPAIYKKPSEYVDKIDFGFCSVEFKRRGFEIKKEKEMVDGER